jgi:hypothetical protein
MQFRRSLWKQTLTAAVNLFLPDIYFIAFSEIRKNCSRCLSDFRGG